MKILFVAKASTKIGYGHLIRSRTLANSLAGLISASDSIHFIVIGDSNVKKLMSGPDYERTILDSESDVEDALKEVTFDVTFFDMLEMSSELFNRLKQSSKITSSISPVFNQLANVDLLFHRTTYHTFDFPETCEVFASMDYALIQQNCVQIHAASYKKHLSEENMSIAISMGGGDAANKSLKVIKALNGLQQNCTIWCMLGEGYKHSYDLLIEETKGSQHEVILAKTNRSMWKMLNLASLIILPGGITSFEAAYAGLPSIILNENKSQKFLVQELVDKDVAITVGSLEQEDNVDEMLHIINKLELDRDKLYEMHLNSKGLIDGLASDRIYEILIKKLHTYDRLN